jgi:hypothetical protein
MLDRATLSMGIAWLRAVVELRKRHDDSTNSSVGA